jgi:hypothetical protein
MNSNFNKDLINTNVDIETLKEEIISRINKLDDPMFNVSVKTTELLQITVATQDKTTTFDVFDVTPEALDTTLTRINEYVEGIRK